MWSKDRICTCSLSITINKFHPPPTFPHSIMWRLKGITDSPGHSSAAWGLPSGHAPSAPCTEKTNVKVPMTLRLAYNCDENNRKISHKFSVSLQHNFQQTADLEHISISMLIQITLTTIQQLHENHPQMFHLDGKLSNTCSLNPKHT